MAHQKCIISAGAQNKDASAFLLLVKSNLTGMQKNPHFVSLSGFLAVT